ncbi:pentapeptide repeat-containing protein [Flagellimonas sp. HMM57]|uniref:pentapeptide repeat-containing protein n=1 Tax=unclassified Flagellimonas TaxID=2644544 RepID=UPI001F0A9CDF|nr:pentapeptide repeat-containing protein [Flagellimonas sp. HSM57]UII75329.1 pentapeptide repeat-containing protein [Flagellimonas sp. HMM57]
MINTDLRETKWKRSSLKGAVLWGENLHHADFTDIWSLDSVKVDRYDWLTYIKDSLNLKGANDIFKQYRMDSILYFEDSIVKVHIIIRKTPYSTRELPTFELGRRIAID